MARFLAITLLFALLFTTLYSPIHASKKPVSIARKEDIPFIKCQVCQTLAKELRSQVTKKSNELSPQKISEYQIIEIAEGVCSLKKEGGDWILRYDIVERGDALELVEQDTEGMCNSECKTIERACQEVMGYYDTDIAEFLYKAKPQIDSLVNFLCEDLSKACSVKPPPVPKDRIPGEPFVPKPSKDAEMEKIMRSMEGMPGAPSMKMYSKEDILNQKFGDDDEDEDDDDEDDFPSKLGKSLRDSKSGEMDWKQRISKGIMDTGMVIKKHVNNASDRMRKWWRGKKTAIVFQDRAIQRMIGKSKEDRGLYIFYATTKALLFKDIESSICHRRLGHLSYTTLKTSLPYLTIDSHNCYVC